MMIEICELDATTVVTATWIKACYSSRGICWVINQIIILLISI